MGSTCGCRLSFYCWGGWHLHCCLFVMGCQFNFNMKICSPSPPPPLPSHPLLSSPESSNNANSSPNANRTLGSDPASSNPRKRTGVAEKGPRVRTVLSEQQLQTLRTVYASNPRPDALLKEHLVELTGLSPRVIRVWFQNKRCKDKKKAIQAEAIARQQQQLHQPKQPQGCQQGKVRVRWSHNLSC